jgi:hypothetical protein
MPQLVLVESPYAGDVATHIAYARKAMRDCFMRGEFPFASHLLYTQPNILDDNIPAERALGIEAGLAWGYFAQKTVVYADYGISKGMAYGIETAKRVERPVEMRFIGEVNGEDYSNWGLETRTEAVTK